MAKSIYLNIKFLLLEIPATIRPDLLGPAHSTNSYQLYARMKIAACIFLLLAVVTLTVSAGFYIRKRRKSVFKKNCFLNH